MASRNLLHRSKLAAFEEWCRAQNYDVQPPVGAYEVLRFYLPNVKPPMLVYDRHNGDHLTVEGLTETLVHRFIREHRAPKTC